MVAILLGGWCPRPLLSRPVARVIRDNLCGLLTKTLAEGTSRGPKSSPTPSTRLQSPRRRGAFLSNWHHI